MTTKAEIRQWLNAAIASGCTHVIIVCDTFDHTDYPVFVKPDEDVRDKCKEYKDKNMQRLMEVYALHLSIDDQINEHRAFHLESKTTTTAAAPKTAPATPIPSIRALPWLPCYVTANGSEEIIDMGYAVSLGENSRDPAVHALLNLLSSGPTGHPDDFGRVTPGDRESAVYRVALTINGRPASFYEIVRRLYMSWEEEKKRAARLLVKETFGEAFDKMSDDLEAIRRHMRTQVPDAFTGGAKDDF